MGRRGPAPKPTALRSLRGERMSGEPVPASTGVSCPESLSAAAKAVWDRLAPDLERKGVLTPWDVDAFAFYCDAIVRHREACERLDAEGVVVTGARGGPIRNPWAMTWRETAEVATRLGARFGLTPADRSQVRPQEPAEVDDILSAPTKVG